MNMGQGKSNVPFFALYTYQIVHKIKFTARKLVRLPKNSLRCLARRSTRRRIAASSSGPERFSRDSSGSCLASNLAARRASLSARRSARRVSRSSYIDSHSCLILSIIQPEQLYVFPFDFDAIVPGDSCLHRHWSLSIMMSLWRDRHGWRRFQLRQQTQAASYWPTAFKVTRADIEFLFSQFLKEEMPLSNEQLTIRLITHRLTQDDEKRPIHIALSDLM